MQVLEQWSFHQAALLCFTTLYLFPKRYLHVAPRVGRSRAAFYREQSVILSADAAAWQYPASFQTQALRHSQSQVSVA